MRHGPCAAQEKARQDEKAARKAAKKQKTAVGKAAAGSGEGEGDLPWKPFDRERDLELRPRAKGASEIAKSAAALGSKFAGGNTQRSFL
jgi:hypothetical protein